MLTCPAAGTAKSEKDNKNAAGSSHFFSCENLAFKRKKRLAGAADAIDVTCITVELCWSVKNCEAANTVVNYLVFRS